MKKENEVKSGKDETKEDIARYLCIAKDIINIIIKEYYEI